MEHRVGEGKSLVETAVEEIIRLIQDNEMKSGERLPNEFELARQLGIGRSTLREATRRLVARNVLEVRQGAGTFISHKMGVPEDPLGLTFLANDPKLAVDLMDIRLLLEPEIAATAARNATEEQLLELKCRCQAVGVAIADGGDYADADVAFHSCLAQCSGNDVLRNLIPVIASSVSVAIRATNDHYRGLTHRQHSRVVEAICRRDPAGAKYAMIMHLNTSREHVVAGDYAAPIDPVAGVGLKSSDQFEDKER